MRKSAKVCPYWSEGQGDVRIKQTSSQNHLHQSTFSRRSSVSWKFFSVTNQVYRNWHEVGKLLLLIPRSFLLFFKLRSNSFIAIVSLLTASSALFTILNIPALLQALKGSELSKNSLHQDPVAEQGCLTVLKGISQKLLSSANSVDNISALPTLILDLALVFHYPLRSERTRCWAPWLLRRASSQPAMSRGGLTTVAATHLQTMNKRKVTSSSP